MPDLGGTTEKPPNTRIQSPIPEDLSHLEFASSVDIGCWCLEFSFVQVLHDSIRPIMRAELFENLF